MGSNQAAYSRSDTAVDRPYAQDPFRGPEPSVESPQKPEARLANDVVPPLTTGPFATHGPVSRNTGYHPVPYSMGSWLRVTPRAISSPTMTTPVPGEYFPLWGVSPEHNNYTTLVDIIDLLLSVPQLLVIEFIPGFQIYFQSS